VEPGLDSKLEAREDVNSDDVEVASAVSTDTPTPLALLLMSLARTELTLRHRSEEGAEFFRSLRHEWSNVLRKFLMNSNVV